MGHAFSLATHQPENPSHPPKGIPEIFRRNEKKKQSSYRTIPFTRLLSPLKH